MKIRELFETQLTRGPAMDLSNKNLTSLQGLHIPDIIEGNFYCGRNKLTSLQYGPTKVGTDFRCNKNRLTSLEFGPKEVNGNYECFGNVLTSLQYGPTEVGGNFYCAGNLLSSLQYCPTRVGGNFDCYENQLTSLQGIHKQFRSGYIKGQIWLSNNPITSHILGLLLIPELKFIGYSKGNASSSCYDAIEIINKHLEGDRNVIACQRELIQAGLKEFARL